MAARLLEHLPASSREFETVRDAIRKRLVEDEARKRALAEGRDKLEKLRKGESAGVDWGKPMTVTRAEPKGLSEPVLREVFRIDASSVPAFAGADDPKAGFHLVRVARVTEPAEIKPDMRKFAQEQLKRLLAQEQLADYVSAMKRRVEVQVKPDLIEKK